MSEIPGFLLIIRWQKRIMRRRNKMKTSKFSLLKCPAKLIRISPVRRTDSRANGGTRRKTRKNAGFSLLSKRVSLQIWEI